MKLKHARTKSDTPRPGPIGPSVCALACLPAYFFLLQLDGNSFLYTRHLNLYLVAVTRGNVNPAMVFEFLYQKIRIFKAYFKRDFDEDTLRNNMTLILELMDGELASD